MHRHMLGRLGAAPLAASLLLGVSSAALAAPTKSDPREARIDQLEQEMQQLIAANQKLQSEDAALAAKAELRAAHLTAN